MAALSINYIPVDKIILDSRNPRVAPAIEGLVGTPPQEYIRIALGQYAPDDDERSSTSYSSLKSSIRAYKGLIHPIVVTQSTDGNYLVIEGNTRVAIYRELASENAPGDWKTVPAIIRENLTEQGEHAIRLQAHLVGPRPWRAYAKAKYLHDLYVDQKLSINEILDYCGGTARKKEIEEYIHAYTDMQNHYMPLMGQNAPDFSRFSAFVELQKPLVKQAIIKAGFTLDDFAVWVNDSKINQLQNIRQLPRILAHPEAKKQFLTHDARQAMRVLEQPSSSAIIKEASLEQLALALTVKIRHMDWSDVKGLKEVPDGSLAQALLDCNDELRALCGEFTPTPNE